MSNLTKEMIKSDIERELAGKGDYVQIDMIRRFLKETLPNEIKRFASEKLAEIYERRSMYAEAAYIYARLAEISLDYADRMKNLIREVENNIKAGYFQGADAAATKITADVKPMEKTKYAEIIKTAYKTQALLYEKAKRRSKAAEIYERMLAVKGLVDLEKRDITERLVLLYKELGMVDKYLQFRARL